MQVSLENIMSGSPGVNINVVPESVVLPRRPAIASVSRLACKATDPGEVGRELEDEQLFSYLYDESHAAKVWRVARDFLSRGVSPYSFLAFYPPFTGSLSRRTCCASFPSISTFSLPQSFRGNQRLHWRLRGRYYGISIMFANILLQFGDSTARVTRDSYNANDYG